MKKQSPPSPPSPSSSSPSPGADSSAGAPEAPAALIALGAEAARLEQGGGDPGAPAQPSEPKPERPKINAQDFVARMLKPFEQLAPKLPYVGYGFERMPWTAADTAMLAAGWGEVIDYYGGVEKLGPWGTAALCSLAVLGPRAAIQPPPKPKAEKPASA